MSVLKRFKGLIVFLLIATCLFGALIVGKSIFLRELKKKIEATFHYSHLRLSYLPPAVYLNDVRTVSASPSFSAKQVIIQISSMSLLSREKPLTIFIDEPVLDLSLRGGAKKRTKGQVLWPFPYPIEKGLVRGGRFHFRNKDWDIQCQKIRVLFNQKGSDFNCQAVSEESLLTPSSAVNTFSGTISLGLSGKGGDVSVHRAFFQGAGFYVKAEGKINNPNNPTLELRSAFNIDFAPLARLLNLPFDWLGKVKGRGLIENKGGELFFDSELYSPGITLNKVPLGEVSGRFRIKGKAGGEVELSLQKKNETSEYVNIRFQDGRIEGRVRGAHLDPILSYAKVPWPVRSLVWGNFVLENKKLTSEGEFRDNLENPEPPRFPFQGKVRFDMDLASGEMSFSSTGLDSSFAQIDVQGGAKVGRDVNVNIQGEIKDVKQARTFTSLILNRNFGFPEIRGKGMTTIRISGDFHEPQVSSSFLCAPGGFDTFNAASVEGSLEILNGRVLGKVRVDDRKMKGDIDLAVDSGRTTTDFRISEGEVESILPLLNISFPVRGKAKGIFTLEQIENHLEFRGAFSSRELTIIGQPVQNVKGNLEWKDGVLRFSALDLTLFKGSVGGGLSLKFPGPEFDIDLAGKDLDLLLLQPGLNGNLSLDLKGKGTFGRDRPRGRFTIKDLYYYPFQRTAADGDWDFDYRGDQIGLNVQGGFRPGENAFRLAFLWPLDKDSVSVDIQGEIDNFDLLLPWKGAKGRLKYLGEIRGPRSAPRLNGALEVQGSLLPLPRFAYALDDFAGLAFVKDGRISVRSFQSKLGGGDIQGGGVVEVGAAGVESIDIKLDGKNMLLSILERTRALADGSVNLIKNKSQFVLDGSFNIARLSWRREITEKFEFSSTPYPQASPEKGFFDDLNLNLELKADDNAWMENSLGKVNGRFDLTVTGNISSPLLRGEIEALGGEVYFQDRTFKVLRGRLNFLNPAAVEPYLDFQGEAHIKDYRITFTLTGLTDSLKPEFTSSPALPPEDVLALLALGEAFQRTYSYDTSTQLSTASLLSFQIAEQAQKRAKGLFSLARFRIDPFILGSSAEMTARLSIGRQISRNLSILYSTNLTTQREEIVRLEWEITKDFSLVGMRNELGRVSFDVKARKRF